MAGLASALELLSTKSSALHPNILHSFASLSAVSAATIAASAAGFLPPYTALPSNAFTGYWSGQTAHCESYIDIEERKSQWSTVWSPPEAHPKKSYDISLKPFFSAFYPKALAITSLRALIVNLQPILETYVSFPKSGKDDDTKGEEVAPSKQSVDADLRGALKGSGRSILREVTVTTTRRLLERIAVQYVSRRVSWKLTKDLSKSAERKAGRQISKFELFLGVKKSTFRGHALAIAATWLVQLALDVYNCIHNVYQKSKKWARNDINQHQEDIKALEREELAMLERKIVGNTVKCGASLVFASIGAGLGAILIRPSSGQWIGCAAGEFAGAFMIGMWIDSWVVFGTLSPPDVD